MVWFLWVIIGVVNNFVRKKRRKNLVSIKIGYNFAPLFARNRAQKQLKKEFFDMFATT